MIGLGCDFGYQFTYQRVRDVVSRFTLLGDSNLGEACHVIAYSGRGRHWRLLHTKIVRREREVCRSVPACLVLLLGAAPDGGSIKRSERMK